MIRKIILDSIKSFLLEDRTPEFFIGYHGTDKKFTSFNDDTPIFFVDNIDVAKTYGRNIIKAKIIMDNPIEIDFNGASTYYFINKWFLPSDLAKKIKEISEDLKNRYSLNDETMEELEDLGFNNLYGDLDGIIMRNIKDRYDFFSSKNTSATNYVVFNKNQIEII